MRYQIKQMEKHPRNYEFNLPYYRKTVELLEKAQRPHGEWIPYSERLPEEGKLVLVTLNPISLKDAVHPVIIAKYTTEMDSWIYTIPDAVLAWMPLPEPYKEEGDEK